MNHLALCLTLDPELRRWLRRSMSAAGTTAEFVDSPDGLTVSSGRPHMVVLDKPARGGKEIERVVALAENGASVVILGESLEEEGVLDLLKRSSFNHVISDLTEENADELVVTSVKLRTGDIFGVEKYLAWGATIHERVVVGYDGKRQAVKDLAEYATEVGLRRQTMARVESVADELLMNAIYDAPVARKSIESQRGMKALRAPEAVPSLRSTSRPDSLTGLRALSTRTRRNSLSGMAEESAASDGSAAASIGGLGPAGPRSRRGSLTGNEQAVLRYGCDGRYFALSVRDSFGELRKEAILEHLRRARIEQGSPLQNPAAGAGLGLYFILSSVTHFIANIKPGEMSEVICLFDVNAVGKNRSRCAKSLHVFTARPGAHSAL